MAHFNIIQLSSDKEDNKILVHRDFFNDPLFQDETDYIGDKLTGKDRRKAIEHFKNTIGACANIDIVNETLTFNDKETVKELYIQQVQKAMSEFVESFADNRHGFGYYCLQKGIKKLSYDTLFYYNDSGQTLASLLADYLDGYLPKTMYIGDIFDANP